MIYFDNAASSWPKPPAVVEAVKDCIDKMAANPGRAQHKMALAAGRVIVETRAELAKLLGIADLKNIVFTHNATESLNMAIKGWVRAGDTVVTTSIEHSSVYRPLEQMASTLGVTIRAARNDRQGRLDVSDFRALVSGGCRLAVVAHASNVLGTILPIDELVGIAGAAGVPVLIDAAQTAGSVGIDCGSLPNAMVAFTGHKGLLGPQGTGGLYVDPGIDLQELKQGGTGGNSRAGQPRLRPDRYESGTMNTPGLAGLGAAAKFINETGLSSIVEAERHRIERLMSGVQDLEGVTVYGPPLPEPRVSLVSFNLEGISAQMLAFRLDQEYDIASRAGFMCAPGVHELIGTEQTGVVRLSPGCFSTDKEVDRVVDALAEIQGSLRSE